MALPPEALPLTGIVVADFSRVLADPLATMTLADLGARVIKIERPGEGDDTRHWGPPYAADGTATYFASVNRNKRSLWLDLSAPDGLAEARALAVRADVMVENFKPGTLARMGLGYDEISRENPRLVLCSVSGFGSGAGADLPGYDLLVQAMGGLMSVTGLPGQGPVRVGIPIADLCGEEPIGATRVAEAVGRKLKDLSSTSQVLCVTHQPQIASMADRHFVVEKDVSGRSTSVTVRELSREEKIEEIARMLAGEHITDAARENARTMLAGSA